MEDWEAHFRAKSSRRAHARALEDRVKLGVLWLLFGSVAAAVLLTAFGLPR